MTTAPPDERHYVYVVVEQGRPIHVEFSRQAARTWLEWQEGADGMRVRRAALRIFEK